MMLRRVATLVVALALGTSACSSSSPSGAPDGGPGTSDGKGDGGDQTGGDDGSLMGVGADGAVSADGSPEASSTGDAPSGSSDGGKKTGDGGTTVAADAGGGNAAGAAGVTAFCTQACNRAAACATMVDGGSLDAATCVSNCTTMNEAGPPNGGDVILYRSDYVVDLTSCVATTDCTDTLGDKAANDCQTSLASTFAPSAAVVTLCQRLEASTCSQDVTPDCLTAFLPYSDATVQAITACIADPTCTNHDACVQQALTP